MSQTRQYSHKKKRLCQSEIITLTQPFYSWMNLGFSLPKTVLVAEFISNNRAVLDQEVCLGLLTRLEGLELDHITLNNGDEFDIVVLFHGMEGGADFNMNLITVTADGRNVLLLGSINGIGLELNHILSTADGIAMGIIDFND